MSDAGRAFGTWSGHTKCLVRLVKSTSGAQFGCCVVCLTSLAMLAASARQRKMIRRFPESCAHSRLGADARARAVFVAAGVTQLAQSVLVAPVVT